MKRIFLIAGHHNNDPGAVSNHVALGGKVTEAQITIELRDLVYHYLILHLDQSQFEIILDNDNDTLTQVISKVNNKIQKDDILVDIHFNAFNTKATGTETLVGNISSTIEKDLAKRITDRLADIMDIANRGVKTESQSGRKRIGILHGAGHRVLPEVCFKDNTKDMITYQKNKHLVAEAIAYEIEKTVLV